MKKPFTLIVIFFVFFKMSAAYAQTKATGKIDSAKLKIASKEQSEKFVKSDSAYSKLKAAKQIKADFTADSSQLALKVCPFEKDANAMVVFDVADVVYGGTGMIMERHRRIKIFNDNGKDQANIRIEYNKKFGVEHILAVVARTINFNNGKVEYTKLDSSLVYNVHTDKEKDAVVFSMPNVKAGSVIEYDYIWDRAGSRNFPDWNFQSGIPTAFSQLNVLLSPYIVCRALFKTSQPFVKDTVADGGFGHVYAMKDIPSSKKEPFMRSDADALQSISIILSAVKSYTGETTDLSESWATVGKQIVGYKDFYKPYDQNPGDDDIVKDAKKLSSNDQKIAFIFNKVKTLMKWNEEKNWFSKDGIKAAWKKKTGNWGEINMILCHYLKEAGVNAYPMLVSTRDNGKLLSNFSNIFQVNKLVVYVPVAGNKSYYVLDATEKFNTCNEVPFDLLNSYGLCLDKEKDKYDLVLLQNKEPAKQLVLITAEIKPEGVMIGKAQISSSSYNKSNNLELHKLLTDEKYKEYLRDNDHNLSIDSLEIENADIDSLPLIQNIVFKLNLPGTDDKYIYFNPNLFTSLHDNPFIGKDRASDIDFGCPSLFSISGIYKLPPGYKVEYIPKNIILVMPDKGISFKRIVSDEDGYIVIHYVINYNQSVYLKNNYEDIYAYFKKMFEILNEQIVLKKA